MQPIKESFFLQPALKVAIKLLGKYFIRELKTKKLIGKIVEVEVYHSNDPASHSYRGITPRNEVMFRQGGYLYVYFTYGMHYCANVVTGKKGIGEAILIRAVEPISGIEIMSTNRYGKNKLPDLKSLLNLTNGPAKFCQAFGINKKQNGLYLANNYIYIAEGENISKNLIGKSARIGIKTGLDKEYRFFIKGNPWVSK